MTAHIRLVTKSLVLSEGLSELWTAAILSTAHNILTKLRPDVTSRTGNFKEITSESLEIASKLLPWRDLMDRGVYRGYGCVQVQGTYGHLPLRTHQSDARRYNR